MAAACWWARPCRCPKIAGTPPDHSSAQPLVSSPAAPSACLTIARRGAQDCNACASECFRAVHLVDGPVSRGPGGAMLLATRLSACYNTRAALRHPAARNAVTRSHLGSDSLIGVRTRGAGDLTSDRSKPKPQNSCKLPAIDLPSTERQRPVG